MAGKITNIEKLQDVILKDGRTDDIVIPVMGLTKAGKSTFINRLLSDTTLNTRVEVGVRLVSCTASVYPVVVSEVPLKCRQLREILQGRRIILVDTPGFDDTYTGNGRILIRLSQWLEKSYRRGKLIGGIIYIHNISNDSFPHSALKNLDIFTKLCGEKAMNLVRLVTTKWERLDTVRQGEDRLSELQESFWKPLIEDGALTHQVRPENGPHFHYPPPTLSSTDSITFEDPWGIITNILTFTDERDRKIQIQDELVSQRRFLIETEAGQSVGSSLNNTLKELKKEKRRGQESAAICPAEDLYKHRDNIKRLTEQIDLLQPTLSQRTMRLVKKLGF
ncbi:hypothetical protein H1R20_g205, partial [Candolleomyces eurysporus]